MNRTLNLRLRIITNLVIITILACSIKTAQHQLEQTAPNRLTEI